MTDISGPAHAGAAKVIPLRGSPAGTPTAPVDSGSVSAVHTDGATPITTILASIAGSGAPIDADKVSRIKAAIAAGQYPVDAGRIAERMIALDLPEQR